ncbi:cytochrome P450 [Mycena albidolilacea]|uniref:Cytochrome P450 n=1 Tax=Mycena albidolilacea TaxID=1033008 RepID=A0AAD7EDJ1_9AGAR|nr:cytochrome P450 [Mycena albidolilacea]
MSRAPSLPDIDTGSLFHPRFIAWIVGGYATYLFIYRVVLYPRFFSPLRNVPGPSRGNPFLGHYLTIVQEESCIPHRRWAKAYGPVVRMMGILGKERLFFLSPDALQQIVAKDWLEYPRPQFMRDVLGLVAGYGLLTTTGEDHKQLRKAMNPAFSVPNLMAQTDMYYEPIDGLLEIMKAEIKKEAIPEAGKVFPMYEWMGKVALDIICDTAFGYKTDCLHNPHNELAVAFEQLLQLQSGPNLAKLVAILSIPGTSSLSRSQWMYRHRWFLGKLPIIHNFEKLVDSLYRIRTISREMLRSKTADLSVSPDDTTTKKDIMSLLVRARKADLDADPTADAMSDTAMVDQVLTFLAAGHETTATGLSWTLWLLANDPESQRRLREEVTPIYEENPHPDYRTIKSLTWLDCVVNESLRVLPPVPLTLRVANKTEYIDGVLVPKGTVITIPIRVINTWKDVWGDDAEEFHPARWLNLPEAYNPIFSQFSFIAGPHGCIGKTMAVSEMKAVLVALVANFEFAPAYPGQVRHPATAITMKPEDNMPLRVTRVANKA